jgi:hypothetical protein
MGLGRLLGRVFRIGHLGFFNDLTLCGALCGVEMGLADCRVPHQRGVDAALSYLTGLEPTSSGAAEHVPGSPRAAERSLNAA